MNILSISGNFDQNTPETELRFADGRLLRVPTALLQEQKALTRTPPDTVSADEPILIPLVEEQLEVGKRLVETGKVYLHKSSEPYEVKVDEPLAINTWKVERIPKNLVLAEAPSPRQEGNTTIYPLIEERLIVTKELVLMEEIHVTQELSERHDIQTITLRRETLNVERIPSQQA